MPTSAIALTMLLVEEAFNQERGVFQNTLVWTRSDSGEWAGNFTQEWPAPDMAHQLSYTVPFAGGHGTPAHVGATLLNYRYQLLHEGPGRPGFSPRASVIVPSGPDESRSLTSPQIAASLVWNAGPLLNLMLESVVSFNEEAAGGGRTDYERVVTVSPGLRGGWNRGDQQIILGAALPVTVSNGTTSLALLTYLSYELPFSKHR